MDLDHLDHLARLLAAAGSRRRLLGVLAALPVAGGLPNLLETKETAAKERRRRRKDRHKRRKNPGNRKHRCKPKSRATVCAGQCGPVKSRQTCGKTVDCGSCDCSPACDACFICQSGPNTPGACVLDVARVGDSCGREGQFCQADGACACQTGRCPTGQCCRADGTCGTCLVFVTSNGWQGNLGGLAGADTLCQDAADAAGLPGDYLAWLSDTSASPSTRFTQATVPYLMPNGTQIAANWDALVDGSLDASLSITEYGDPTFWAGVWTGTKTNGTLYDQSGTCASWSSSASSTLGLIGQTNAPYSVWTAASLVPCDDSDQGARALYCFQQR